jgi:hypothetical protein
MQPALASLTYFVTVRNFDSNSSAQQGKQSSTAVFKKFTHLAEIRICAALS